MKSDRKLLGSQRSKQKDQNVTAQFAQKTRIPQLSGQKSVKKTELPAQKMLTSR